MIFTARHIGGIIDVSLRNKQALLQARTDLGMMRERFVFLLQNAPIGIFYYDQNLHISDLNQRMAQIMRLDDKSRLVGFDLHAVSDKRILPALEAILRKEEGHYEGPFYSSLADRSLYIELLSVPLLDSEGELTGAVCFFQDLTAEMEAKETIAQNAFYDPLTKLPNRTLFTDRLGLAIEQSRRHRFNCAVLFIDLDHFKQINDNLGHYVGDRTLYQVGQRLLEHVRSEDTVARVGGDEFLVLLNALPNTHPVAEKTAMRIADGLIEALQAPFSIDEHIVNISASVGIYVFDGSQQTDTSTIIKHADIAMYHAKQTGRGHAELYHSSFEDSQKETLAMERDIRRALERREFSLFFQPKVSMHTDRIEQVEALIRWNHPEKGLVMPDEFIPFAERTGLILPIGEWVFETCLRQLREWLDNETAPSLKNVAVNISPIQFDQPGFVPYVKEKVSEYALPPSMIEFELTEGVMVGDAQNTIAKITELEAFGIKIALDDFGTGYSSLSYLRHLPVSIIKIDRSFIADLRHSKNALMIVKTIVTIAKSLDMTVIAEGVESEEELSTLRQLGCDYYQGFYCEEALPADRLIELLDNQRCQRKDA
jgi:diguanylate cyclase (GGDEF)-like protein